MSSAEGLQAIVDKNEVVPTRRAVDFLERPKEVHDTYKFHAQTYVPVHIGAESDTRTGVEGFAKKFLKRVRDKKSPRGYITAEFGYGKTSTGLYVWEQAEQERIIALPPFQLNRLSDFIDATYGWVQYELGLTSPTHQQQSHDIYQKYTRRSLEDAASRYNTSIDAVRKMVEDGRLNLALTPDDILAFFREMSELVLDADFGGLVVIADEIQQYLDPQIRSGTADPIGPLFDIVQGLADERQNLAFGFLLIMPSMQLGLISDQRGDLIDRMRDFTLDLKTIYDREFPARLWQRLAEIYDFTDARDNVIDSHALAGLGQIASRTDLSNGPRTVVNVIKLASRRFLQSNNDIVPYSPIDLIDSFLTGDITFDGTKQIQEAVIRALEYDFVQQHADLERAVRLAAAFPQEGAPQAVQERYGLRDAFLELRDSGFGDVVIEVGDRRDPGITLRGLDDVPNETDEISLMLRDFGRNYIVEASTTIERTVQGFVAVLNNVVFGRNWKLIDQSNSDMFQATELVYEGAFAQMASEFPQRQVHVVIITDGSADRDYKYEGECHLIFDLRRHLDKPVAERQHIHGEVTANDQDWSARFTLNLMQPATEAVSSQLGEQLSRTVDSSRITALMILTLHEYLSEKLGHGQLSKRVAQMVESSINRQLIQAATQVLFNPELGAELDANGPKIVERVVHRLIEDRYGDRYQTLVTYPRWRDVLRTYIGGLKKLPSTSQKRGLIPLTGSRQDIAEHFDDTVTGIENKFGRMPDFVRVEISTNRETEVWFQQHPLENDIIHVLEQSLATHVYEGETLRCLLADDVYHWSREIGYLDDEIEHVLRILEARDMIILEGADVIEAPKIQVSLSELTHQLNQLDTVTHYLVQAFPKPDVEQQHERVLDYQERLQSLDPHDETELIKLQEMVSALAHTIASIRESRISDMRQRVEDTIKRIPQSDASHHKQLNEPFRVPVYGEALNDVAHAIATEYRRVAQRIAALQADLEQLQQQMQTPDTSTLPRLASQLQVAVRESEDLSKSWTQIKRAADQIRRWHTLADGDVKLMQRIRDMGDAALDFRDMLESLRADVHKQLIEHGTDAVSQIGDAEARLKSIEKDLDNQRSVAKSKFGQEEARYRRALIRDGGISEHELWSSLLFNPESPKAFYDNLYDNVQKLLAKILDYLSDDQIARQQNVIRQLRANSRIAQRISDESIDIIYQEYEEVKAILPYDRNIIEQIRNPETFDQIIADIRKARDHLDVLAAKVRDIQNVSEQPSRSPEAEAVYRAYQDLVSDNRDVDLVEIRDRVTLGEDQFWAALRELWQEQGFRILLESHSD